MGSAIPEGQTVRKLAAVVSVTVTFSTTADTPVAGTLATPPMNFVRRLQFELHEDALIDWARTRQPAALSRLVRDLTAFRLLAAESIGPGSERAGPEPFSVVGAVSPR
ncbi:MAG TPA: hypothetical protein VKF59_11440 [Candidatus Dormibacteraeota bacterium]|nr:hypothetical protein [Candidatus Dormibacteraeota bacterium]